MASDFDTTEFVDTDVQAAPVAATKTEASADGTAPSQKELEGKATDVVPAWVAEVLAE